MNAGQRRPQRIGGRAVVCVPAINPGRWLDTCETFAQRHGQHVVAVITIIDVGQASRDLMALLAADEVDVVLAALPEHLPRFPRAVVISQYLQQRAAPDPVLRRPEVVDRDVLDPAPPTLRRPQLLDHEDGVREDASGPRRPRRVGVAPAADHPWRSR